jgi:hypothetical protein
MKIDKARQIAKKVDEIENLQEKIKRFNNTNQFCSVRIVGENGMEHEHSFYITYKKDSDEINSIRKYIAKIYEDKIEKLYKELEKL